MPLQFFKTAFLALSLWSLFSLPLTAQDVAEAFFTGTPWNGKIVYTVDLAMSSQLYVFDTALHKGRLELFERLNKSNTHPVYVEAISENAACISTGANLFWWNLTDSNYYYTDTLVPIFRPGVFYFHRDNYYIPPPLPSTGKHEPLFDGYHRQYIYEESKKFFLARTTINDNSGIAWVNKKTGHAGEPFTFAADSNRLAFTLDLPSLVMQENESACFILGTNYVWQINLKQNSIVKLCRWTEDMYYDD